MPVAPTYPGVYIQEEQSNVRTVVGVATSITAFVGRALRGPVNDPVSINGYAEFARLFGGPWQESTMSYAVQHFFANGGGEAIIVRVHNGATAARIALPAGGVTAVELVAADPGAWGNALRAQVTSEVAPGSPLSVFTLIVQELVPGTTDVRAEERFLNVSWEPTHRRSVRTVLEQESRLARVLTSTARPDDTPGAGVLVTTSGTDGSAIGALQVSDPTLESPKEGLWALDDADIFNLLVIPPFTRDTATGDLDTATRTAAMNYCIKRRAIFLLDPPLAWNDPGDLLPAGLATLASFRTPNVAFYWPHLIAEDPLQENRTAKFAPSGAAAGIIARIDAQRGVWKAPAGQEATVRGVRELEYKLTDEQNGRLNPLGVNCLRTFPIVGSIVWGARTFAGADALASQWKYLPVRRLALYIEESLYRGTQWVVFEPNDEPLWAQIRLNVGAFMHGLFRQGAFQGRTPREAYLVKCDAETTPQEDIDRGIVNVIVGFAPLKPAEFVIITIRQLARTTAP